MRKTSSLKQFVSVVIVIGFCLLIPPAQTRAQVRGVYPLGMSATNSGVTPEPGFTYSNLFLFYSRNQLKDPDGKVVSTGNNSVAMDMNSFVWVSKKEILGGAKFSMSATLPVANNSLTSDVVGPISGGSGLADSYYQPLILGWNMKRAAIRAVYGFLAPTGRFKFDQSNNVGSGYWTHALSSGQTFYLTKDKALSVSAFEMYEFHTRQNGTGIRPGQTMNLDYSLMQSILVRREWGLHLGLAGYEQWQTTGKNGPSVTSDQAKARYRVNALGFAANISLPKPKVTLGFRYFKEFANRSTFQGYSVQVWGALHF